MTTHLYHFGLTVRDLDKSLAFYRDVVGMEQEYYSEVASDAFDELIANSGVKIRFVYLTLAQFRLQLIEYVAGGDNQALPLQHNRAGNPHMSIWVDDVEAKYAEVIGRGDVNVTSGIITQEYQDIGARNFYVTDPDGVQVEFSEKLYDRVSHF